MSTYKFGGGEDRKAFGPLDPGDYEFVVSDCGEPYKNSKSGNWVISVKLSIQPGGETVFANPWAGTTYDGEERDGIGDFLLAVNRAPARGQEPDWRKVVGARGKCRLKVEIAQQGALAGKEVNKVAFFHRPKELERREPQPYPKAKAGQSAPQVAKNAGGGEVEPDEIPF